VAGEEVEEVEEEEVEEVEEGELGVGEVQFAKEALFKGPANGARTLDVEWEPTTVLERDAVELGS